MWKEAEEVFRGGAKGGGRLTFTHDHEHDRDAKNVAGEGLVARRIPYPCPEKCTHLQGARESTHVIGWAMV